MCGRVEADAVRIRQGMTQESGFSERPCNTQMQAFGCLFCPVMTGGHEEKFQKLWMQPSLHSPRGCDYLGHVHSGWKTEKQERFLLYFLYVESTPFTECRQQLSPLVSIPLPGGPQLRAPTLCVTVTRR